MDNLTLSAHLFEILQKSKIVFLKTTPEILDFTTDEEFKLFIFGSGKKLELSVNKTNIHSICGILSVSLFDEGVSVLGWNFKSLFSYFTFYLKKPFVPQSSILDLKVVENFNGIRKQKAPESLAEAIARYRGLGEASWISIYKKIHLPLITKVIPYMETFPLVDKLDRKLKYAYYEIEGQSNGRLQVSNAFNLSYNPHNMSEKRSSFLRPSISNNLFCYMDYKHMEVTVLAYLSQDSKLKELLASGGDLYSDIYQIITGEVCDTKEKRAKCKLMFLPIMYGLGAKGLAKEFEISIEEAANIVTKTKEVFRTAYDWFSVYHQMAANEGKAVDSIGRTRYFGEESYLARNFALQAPAAIFCLEKLIDLYNISNQKFRLVFNVHDGYGMICDRKYIKECISSIKKSLESESNILPGLSLKAQISFGVSLDQMKVLGI